MNYTQLIYALHACAVLTGVFTSSSIAGRFLFGLPSLLAVILNYARRAEARGTWLESHFEWQIHTFWYALLWIAVTLLIGAPFTLVVIGVYIVVMGFCARRIVGGLPGGAGVAELARTALRASTHPGGGPGGRRMRRRCAASRRR